MQTTLPTRHERSQRIFNAEKLATTGWAFAVTVQRRAPRQHGMGIRSESSMHRKSPRLGRLQGLFNAQNVANTVWAFAGTDQRAEASQRGMGVCWDSSRHKT
jgi:hypothetical protein